MSEYNKKLFARITRTMCEWSGGENLDDHHVGLLADMVTFASIPILVGTCNTPEAVIGQLNEITKAAFNLGYAKGLYDNAPKT